MKKWVEIMMPVMLFATVLYFCVFAVLTHQSAQTAAMQPGGTTVVLDAGDAEHLHVADASVDVATVAFGVRNFGDLDAGLREMARTIKPGGKVVVLEFSRPRNRLFRALYEFYTYKILPRIGGMVSKDKRAYEYLPASVGEFPAPKEFMAMMERAGFRECRARSQSFGIAQIYTGQK